MLNTVVVLDSRGNGLVVAVPRSEGHELGDRERRTDGRDQGGESGRASFAQRAVRDAFERAPRTPR